MADKNITNYHLIGVDPHSFENWFGTELFSDDDLFEEVGPNGDYLVVCGGNDERIFLFLEESSDEADLIGFDPMFSKGGWFDLELKQSFDVPAPNCYTQSILLLDVLDNDTPCTRVVAMMVNKPTFILGYERTWYGRKRQVQYGMEVAYGTRWRAKLAIFAHSVTHFETEQAFLDSQTADGSAGSEIVDVDGTPQQFLISSTSFFPHGLVSPELGKAAPFASGTGPVTSCGTAKSSFNGPDYHWAVVGALGGSFGVVWSPSMAPAAQIGGYLSYDGMVIGEMAAEADNNPTSHPAP